MIHIALQNEYFFKGSEIVFAAASAATKRISLSNFTSLSVSVGGNLEMISGQFFSNGGYSGFCFSDNITCTSSISQIYLLFKQSPIEQLLKLIRSLA